MRRLGISVYPEHAPLEKNKEYISTAAKYGFDRIFTCLLSVTGDKDSIVKEFKETIDHAKNLNFEVIVDVAPSVFTDLGITYEDLSFFKEMGVDGFRLDEGFTGAEEAMMTFNKEGLMVELNVSQPNMYLENILSYCADSHKLLGCHNFYPKKRTALSRELFMTTSQNYKNKGIRVAAFVNSKNATFGPWKVSEGLCTLEEHRYIEDITVQARDLWNTNVVDDVIVANCFASEAELKALGELKRGLLALDVDLEVTLSETESNILYDELHFFRGDRSEYTVRSTMPRIVYKDKDIKPQNTRNIKRGDVIIENSNYDRYKGELHIALRDYENEGNSNVIGRIREDNLIFIDQIRPWQKFKLV
ncbi:MAG: DUF871 domain-containing protein [Psychrilyobacter sp.]|nr:DUF871 domain-containing protein [Psychrilyobacter sp.]